MNIDLKGTWTLQEQGKDSLYPAQVPGDNASCLLEAGVIPDPYWGKNEDEVQWIKDKTWIWERQFNISGDLLEKESIILNLDEIDTCATIYINDLEIGRTTSQFIRYRFEAKSALKCGENTIRVCIEPALDVAQKRADQSNVPVPNTWNNTVPHLNHLRKTQCHGGWDWGITLLVSGIYGDISLQAHDHARIEHITTTQKHQQDFCQLEVSVELWAPQSGSTDLKITFAGEQKEQKTSLVAGINQVRLSFDIEKPELWWPVGYGEAKLHPLVVATEEQSIEKNIGLRNIHWKNEADDKGESMVLNVNGIDIFCKGANWIPMDAMPQRYSRQRYQQLLSDAKAANMNMIRLWGGGHYEREDFYDICDREGLLIWHDFMFACSLYPSNKDYLKEIQQEVVYQIKRLKDHCSIALWCGDNEVIGAIGWYPESIKSRDTYVASYQKLSTVLEHCVESTDPDRVFWPSSPCSGSDPFAGDGWHDDKKGDMHYWDVWHSGKDFEAYFDVQPRFCSEFGFQSLSSLETVKTFAELKDFNATSPVLEHHQKNDAGNQKILEMFTRYFRMPNGFENFLYLSQVQQALAIKMAVEYWRHLQPTCMGTVIWQLNDNWPVASWSTIEYNGQWKQLQYHCKRFFNKVLGTAFQKDDQVEFWAVSELATKAQAHLKAHLYHYNGEHLKTFEWQAEVEARGSLQLASHALDELTSSPESHFIELELVLDDGQQKHEHRNTHMFARPKACQLEEAKVNLSTEVLEGQLQVRISTNKPCFFTTLNLEGCYGVFDDNSFTLLPEQDKVVTFTPRDAKADLAAVKDKISLKHLRESY